VFRFVWSCRIAEMLRGRVRVNPKDIGGLWANRHVVREKSCGCKNRPSDLVHHPKWSRPEKPLLLRRSHTRGAPAFPHSCGKYDIQCGFTGMYKSDVNGVVLPKRAWGDYRHCDTDVVGISMRPIWYKVPSGLGLLFTASPPKKAQKKD